MKLNFLLVMPRFITNSNLGYFFPLGLPYVSSSMKKAGFTVYTLNLNHKQGDIPNILQETLFEKNINVLLTGGLSPHYSIIRDIVENAKIIKPSLKIIVGGGIISSDPETAMTGLEFVDYGIIGEGEDVCCELAQTLENNSDVSQVNGIIYKNNDGTYHTTRPRKETVDIDSIPWPDYEGFEFEKAVYGNPSTNGLNVNGVLHMILSRSCPFNCTFCFHTVGKKYRQRSLDNFFAELDFMLNKYPVKYLSLIDDLFANDIDRIKEFCKRIKGYKINWEACFRVDSVNEEILQLLKESGCNFMTFGLESADNRILKSMKKAITVEKIEETLKLVYENSIHFMGAFIFGDKEETVETATNTIKWWENHPEYSIALSRIICYPGTYLYKYACEHGIIKDKVKFLKEGCPHVNVSKMTNEEFAEILKIITDVSNNKIKPPDKFQLFNINYIQGTFDAKGYCRNCQSLNTWRAIQIFRPNYLNCLFCEESYNIIYPSDLYKTIDRNLTKLLSLYDKLGIWCMSLPFQDIVKKSNVIFSDNIYFIDISEISQNSNIYGKKIYPPSILNEKIIPLVICTLPTYQSTIEKRIEKDHKSVQKVIPLHQLCNPNLINTKVDL